MERSHVRAIAQVFMAEQMHPAARPGRSWCNETIKLMSFIEAIANVGVGYMIAVVAQMLVFPLFGLTITLLQNLQIGLIFTGISIARSFVLRRLFEAARERRSDKNRSGKSCSYSRASANEIAAFNERAVAVKE